MATLIFNERAQKMSMENKNGTRPGRISFLWRFTVINLMLFLMRYCAVSDSRLLAGLASSSNLYALGNPQIGRGRKSRQQNSRLD